MMNYSASEELDRILAVMFASFPASSGDPDAALAGYKLAVGDCDMAQVREAVKRFVRGDVAGFNPRFAPSAAELSLASRRCPTSVMIAEYERRKLLPMPAPRKPEPQSTPEERQEIAKRIAAMTGEYLKRSAVEVPPEPKVLDEAFWARANSQRVNLAERISLTTQDETDAQA